MEDSDGEDVVETPELPVEVSSLLVGENTYTGDTTRSVVETATSR